MIGISPPRVAFEDLIDVSGWAWGSKVRVAPTIRRPPDRCSTAAGGPCPQCPCRRVTQTGGDLISTLASLPGLLGHLGRRALSICPRVLHFLLGCPPSPLRV